MASVREVIELLVGVSEEEADGIRKQLRRQCRSVLVAADSADDGRLLRV